MKIIWKMNYCNFSKVFQARTSKDKNVLEWLQSDKTVECPSKPRYIHNLSDQQRFSNYISLVSKFPKLHMPYSTFRLNVHRVQDLLTKPSYYCSNNKQREREKFSQIISHTRPGLLFPRRNKKRIHYQSVKHAQIYTKIFQNFMFLSLRIKSKFMKHVKI